MISARSTYDGGHFSINRYGGNDSPSLSCSRPSKRAGLVSAQPTGATTITTTSETTITPGDGITVPELKCARDHALT